MKSSDLSTDAALRIDLIPGTMCDDRLWHKLLPLLPATITPAFVPLYKGRTRAQMAALVAAHSAPAAHLVGFSMGAYLALEHALAHPDRVRSLVLIATSGRGLRPEEKERRQRTMAALEKHAFAGMPMNQLRSFVHPAHLDDASIAGTIQQMALDLGKATMLAQFVASMDRPDLMARLTELRCPVLVVGAEDDQMVGAAELRAMAPLVPRGSLAILDGSGHMIPLEVPQPLATALVTFYGAFSH
ncbi:alpha/beta fold hydrolase [Pseudoduganella lurida]|nr:alpha/beta hydrolase [Pseudoduganella lurida]